MTGFASRAVGAVLVATAGTHVPATGWRLYKQYVAYGRNEAIYLQFEPGCLQYSMVPLVKGPASHCAEMGGVELVWWHGHQASGTFTVTIEDRNVPADWFHPAQSFLTLQFANTWMQGQRFTMGLLPHGCFKLDHTFGPGTRAQYEGAVRWLAWSER